MARPYRENARLLAPRIARIGGWAARRLLGYRAERAVAVGPSPGRNRRRFCCRTSVWVGVFVAWNCLLAGCQRSESGVPSEYREWDRSGESAEKEILQMPKDS